MVVRVFTKVLHKERDQVVHRICLNGFSEKFHNGRGQDVYENYTFIYFTSFTYLFHPNSFSRVAQGFVIKYCQYEQEIY